MKYNIYIIIIAFILLFVSCKKKLTEMNTNPNEPTWVEPSLLFKESQKNGAGNYNSDVNVEQWALMNWCMYIAARGGVTAGDEYVVPSGKDAFWEEQFTGGLMNCQETINLCGDSAKYVNLKSAARIWKVFLFHRITDLWGEIPYSEALKGYSDLNFTPKYDTQKKIYYHMIKELKEASASFDNSILFNGAEHDLIFSGNNDGWKRFANSLRLRLATHIKSVDFEKYASELSDLQNVELIENNSQSVLFPFNMDGKNHIYEADFSGQAATQNNPSHFFVEMLKSTNDPRLPIFCKKAPISSIYTWFEEYKGTPNLLPNNDPVWNNFQNDWTDISTIGSWFLRAETPGVFVSYSEVCFLKAEAALEGLWPGDPLDYTHDGIRANINFYKSFGEEEHQIDDALIETYINKVTNGNLETIITQKWISFAFENGYEAYTEYRRTGYPYLKDYHNQDINQNIFPTRMPYPSSESSLNGINYSSSVSRQGADNEFTKLWWDVN
jgi:hypothetical protein